MSTCVLGVSSQKVSFGLGITALACWLIPVLKLGYRFWSRHDQEDAKYVKKRVIFTLRPWNGRWLGIALCMITSVVCLWNPWTLSWLSWPRFLQPYIARQPNELGCDETSQILLGEVIGQGFYAAVRAAKYNNRDMVVKGPNPRLDIFQDGTRQQFVLASFMEEKKLLRQVQYSPHLVQLLGGCKEQLFLERLDVPLKEYIASQNSSLAEMEVLGLWLAVASAIDALHRAVGGSILHMDIKPDQFLFTSDHILKLTDLNRAYQLSIGLEGTCRSSSFGRYKSPEQHRGGLVTTKSDVYSMGLLFFYILTGKEPYQDENTGNILNGGSQGEHPRIPEATSPHLQTILEKNWQLKPEDRPSALEVREQLERLIEAV